MEDGKNTFRWIFRHCFFVHAWIFKYWYSQFQSLLSGSLSTHQFQIKPGQGHIEKWVLRKAFDDEEHPYLPKVHIHYLSSFYLHKYMNCFRLTCPICFMQHILYRQKEQFSDGVGYNWIDGLKAHAAQHVPIWVFVLYPFVPFIA